MDGKIAAVSATVFIGIVAAGAAFAWTGDSNVGEDSPALALSSTVTGATTPGASATVTGVPTPAFDDDDPFEDDSREHDDRDEDEDDRDDDDHDDDDDERDRDED